MNKKTESSGDIEKTGFDYYNDLWNALRVKNIENAKEIIIKWIFLGCKSQDVVNIFEKYNVIIQYDSYGIQRRDADKIYSTIKSFDEKKDILLILFSYGGDPASAYMISKLCREYAAKRFIVVVPRLAKSAATLLCCGADEIHMGSLSELGPIDPQFNYLPALGLKNAVEQIAEIVGRQPGSSQLFSDYLAKTVRPIDIGYFNRVVASAAQYAERLLCKRINQEPILKIKEIANKLVYEYSDHGFVIDTAESKEIFGERVHTDSAEYVLGDSLYSILASIFYLCANNVPNIQFRYIGTANSCEAVEIQESPSIFSSSGTVPFL